MDWYLEMLNDCISATSNEVERIIRIWARSVVYFFEPSDIERFFRGVSGSRDMPRKAGLSRALTHALAQRVASERRIFWGDVNDALLVANLRTAPESRRDEDSKCSKMIQKLTAGFQAELKLMYLLTCDYPVGIETPPLVMQAKRQMNDLDDLIDDVSTALRVALDRLETILALDDDTINNEGEVKNEIATARWLVTVLYQLYARKRTLMWQVAMQNGS